MFKDSIQQRIDVVRGIWARNRVVRVDGDLTEAVLLERSLGNLVQAVMYGEKSKLGAVREVDQETIVQVSPGGDKPLDYLKHDGVRASAELITSDGEYKWLVFGEEETGMKMVVLEDMKTGVTISTQLAKPEARTAAWKAWSGARQSRSPYSAWRIGHELVEQAADADKKAGGISSGEYGHASVADMARLTIDISGAPMGFYFRMFNLSSVNSGQEKSTRFQDGFSRSALPRLETFIPKDGMAEQEWLELEKQYLQVAETSLGFFDKWRNTLTERFADYYKVDMSKKSQKGALDARVLDTARRFLLLGFNSGMNFESSARDMARIIGILKGSQSELEVRIANQLEILLSPGVHDANVEDKLVFKAEAPTLIRHAETYRLVQENLVAIEDYLRNTTTLLTDLVPKAIGAEPIQPDVEYIGREFSAAEKMAAQYIITVFPEFDFKDVLEWVRAMPNVNAVRLGELIFASHNNHKQMLSQAETTENTKVVEASLAVVRDLNRHRAQARFVPFLSANRGVLEMLGNGFVTPQYLTDVKEFADLREDFEIDMMDLYEEISGFVGRALYATSGRLNLEVVKQLAPLSLNVQINLHGNPRQDGYMENQRVLPGGDFEYTWLAWWMNALEAESEPLLQGMRIKNRPDLLEVGVMLDDEPSAADRARFLSRK